MVRHEHLEQNSQVCPPIQCTTAGFADGGAKLTIDKVGTYNYTYDIREDNDNARTLAELSTEASTTMLSCDNCPHRTFEKFYKYYGAADYGDKFVNAALDGKSTSFTNGNSNFAGLDRAARAGKYFYKDHCLRTLSCCSN